MPQNGNLMGNVSDNNYHSNRNPQSSGSNPTKPYQQSSPNRYKNQQNQQFLVQQSEPPTQVMR
jgi:hypothetical protein